MDYNVDVVDVSCVQSKHTGTHKYLWIINAPMGIYLYRLKERRKIDPFVQQSM